MRRSMSLWAGSQEQAHRSMTEQFTDTILYYEGWMGDWYEIRFTYTEQTYRIILHGLA